MDVAFIKFFVVQSLVAMSLAIQGEGDEGHVQGKAMQHRRNNWPTGRSSCDVGDGQGRRSGKSHPYCPREVLE